MFWLSVTPTFQKPPDLSQISKEEYYIFWPVLAEDPAVVSPKSSVPSLLLYFPHHA